MSLPQQSGICWMIQQGPASRCVHVVMFVTECPMGPSGVQTALKDTPHLDQRTRTIVKFV